MGKNTAIAWTHHSFNPWWGCQRVSPGCENCYAETFAKRCGFDVWGPSGSRRMFGDPHWAEPLMWQRSAKASGVRERVFCASMADVFEDRRDLDEARERLWTLIEATPDLDWQILTKRPENMLRLAPRWADSWPKNAWAGTTVEDQARADLRLPFLRRVPAATRFISYEPALGPVVLDHESLIALSWVIYGGETGGTQIRRPSDPAWLKAIEVQCQAAGLYLFVKQDGGARPGLQGRISDRLWAIKEIPVPA